MKIESNKLDNELKDKEYTDNLEIKEEYYCERCDKEILEEEHEEYCGLCEDCYSEVYFGERYNGDDYDLYK